MKPPAFIPSCLRFDGVGGGGGLGGTFTSTSEQLLKGGGLPQMNSLTEQHKNNRRCKFLKFRVALFHLKNLYLELAHRRHRAVSVTDNEVVRTRWIPPPPVGRVLPALLIHPIVATKDERFWLLREKERRRLAAAAPRSRLRVYPLLSW